MNINDDKAILCVGICVLDIIHIVSSYPLEDTDTSSAPVDDSDIRPKHARWQRGGNASNICTVLSQLGAKCEFIGPLPNTKMFQFVIDDCLSRRIKMDNCKLHDNCGAPVSSVLLSESTGSRTIIFSNANLPILKYDDFSTIDLNQYKWIHFESRNREETVQMIDMIVQWNSNVEANCKITISIEFEKPLRENLILAPHADVIFVGKDFASHFGWTKEVAVHEIAKYAKQTSVIICPWGDEGAVALDGSTGVFSTAAPCPPVTIVDTLGAGDTFVAATIYLLDRQNDVQKAIEFGCQVAGAKVGFYGYDDIGDLFGRPK